MIRLAAPRRSSGWPRRVDDQAGRPASIIRLAASSGWPPGDPVIVFDGWWEGTPQARPDEAAGLLVAAPVEGDTWETLLLMFGRDPGWGT